MPENVATRLNELVKTLERDIGVATVLGVDCTAELLRMARLNLLAHIHGISDEELQAVSDALRVNASGPRDKGYISGNQDKKIELPVVAAAGALQDQSLHKVNDRVQSLPETIYFSRMPVHGSQAPGRSLGKPYLATVDGVLTIRAANVVEHRGAGRRRRE
jgi:hypothetical protein